MRKEDLNLSLIVSCQPVPGGAMDEAIFVSGFARAALAAGARALRIESAAYVAAVRAAVDAPIIGIVKRDLDDSPVRITPFIADVEALADAGADIIAFDATDRPRPETIEALLAAIKARGLLSMADCSCLKDAERALEAGVDFVGTTMSGYVGGPEPVEPDIALIAAMRQLTPYVIAEGRIRTPEQAAEAVRAGAGAVVVGSAITRTEHVTSWFDAAVSTAFSQREGATLAIDIGGTKTLAALVRGTQVLAERTIATSRQVGPDAWLAAIAEQAQSWSRQYDRVGIAATGLIDDGRWSALNPATLAIPDAYPLAAQAENLFGKPAFAVNDAQAAAWGEHRFGAGNNEDTVFLTISTGIGGGVVVNGQPLLGLAGHFGLIRGPTHGQAPLEDVVSGRWMAAEAARTGHPAEAPEIFQKAREGTDWAEAIVAQSAARVALLCRDIQMMFAPKRIVIGGGIGLAPGYLEAVRAQLAGLAPHLAPHLVAASLGPHAGIIGAADLAGRQR
ncbi:putative N-acetylmannosamine-6-phosphate 2-epimerase [Rhizobium sp. WW_1]|jgi:N-acetylmannosamine-6-phosphate 2-epimerase/N-acetylmannosamine kinase|uniref:putative N-acetylmannosamine-6-phosphate 2-epimerase n=1 Tax=Rhizobium sp. WW_1 TaxID=1907375 RepID=UPI000645BA33|nr:putative N-acetylmannosamine-6-phosphate 2-epimerase [Rhizobium sp. WW_1]RKD68931.1 N-acetylmannosamine-6-phosphate 2-epimerase/N-acetylmannosamine kinase [Rhizobium sp. WW_1]